MRTIGAALVFAVACGADHGAVERVPDARATDAPDVVVEPREAGAGGAPALPPGCSMGAGARCGYSPPIDAAPPDAEPDGGATLDLEYSAMLAPGEESNICAPVDGPKALSWVTGWRAALSSVHHAGVWMVPTATKPSESCGAGGNLLFTALTNGPVDIPVAGGAMRVPVGYRFVLDVHRLNASPEPVTATAKIALALTDTPKTEVFTSWLDGHTFSVPAASEQAVSFSCAVPAAVSFVSLAIHTHSHTKWATVSADGRELYRLENWSEPAMQTYDPFRAATLSWSCDIANNTPSAMTFGLGRDTGEMCQVYAFTLGARFACSK